MALPAPALPTLKDELDRKTFETIEHLVAAERKGRMTKAQVSASLDTLFMAVSGLVDNDFIHIITEAQTVVGGDKSVVKRHFVLPDRGIIQTVAWVPGTDKFTTCQRDDGHAVAGAVKEFDSVEKAARAFARLGEGFESKGWIEL